jgi:hypothetical protein
VDRTPSTFVSVVVKAIAGWIAQKRSRLYSRLFLSGSPSHNFLCRNRNLRAPRNHKSQELVFDCKIFEVFHRILCVNGFSVLNNKNVNIIVRKIFTYTRRPAYDKASFIRGDISTSIFRKFSTAMLSLNYTFSILATKITLWCNLQLRPRIQVNPKGIVK